MDFQNMFRDALNSEDRFKALYQAAVDLRKEDVDKDAILEALQSFRSFAKDEEEEDIVLDVVDCLIGWCGPNMRID